MNGVLAGGLIDLTTMGKWNFGHQDLELELENLRPIASTRQASDLNLLTQIGDINTLRLAVSDEQLGSGEAFPQIAGLTELSIFMGRWPTELLHNISKCKSLKSLSLSGAYFGTSDELRPITEMQNLECLSLSGFQMKDEVLLLLAEMSSLRELRVNCDDLTQTGFEYLTQIKSLELPTPVENGCVKIFPTVPSSKRGISLS